MNSILRVFRSPALFAFFFVPALLCAQGSECSITVSAVNGSVTSNSVMGKGGALSSGGVAAKGDTLKVGEGGSLELNVGGAILKAASHSVIYVDVSYCDATSRSVRLKLLSGSIWAQGNAAAPKFEIATERFMATVGTATLSINARYLDTSFTIAQQSQMIETRDWKDTVEVQRYTFPFKGHIATLFVLNGSVMVLPWGGRGAMMKQGNQGIYGFDESFISSKPQPIKQEDLLYDVNGTYRGK